MSGKAGRTSQLATTDSAGRRLWVYPADVRGRFRSRRVLVNAVLLVFFLLLPWIRVGGHPALLLDFTGGRFSVMGLSFWSHDAPLLLFVGVGAAVALAFVTSVWGRLWCGWSCPQTVFVDGVFRRIERWIEGDAFVRRRLDRAPWTFAKVLKKTLKWTAFLLISLILSHFFLAYFIGTDALARMMSESPAKNPGSFLAMAGISAAVLFDFGWLREQFCTLLCPYGRFQSVLMDDRSLAVAYDAGRGEPRRKEVPVGGKAGDCVNCLRCVQVCPTGIDIRNGLQLECIACTACIDACDRVMETIGKPVGLIRYTSGWGGPWRTALMRFARPLLYFAVLVVLGGGAVWLISTRQPVAFGLVRAVGAPYEEVRRPGLEVEVVNRFSMDLLNQTFGPVTVVALAEQGAGDSAAVQIVSPVLPLVLQPGESKRADVFIRFPLARVPGGHGRLVVLAESRLQTSPNRVFVPEEVSLVGPLR